jgi:hypothetical protein
MRHFLKTVSPFFEAVERGEKTFEIRKDDRDFQVGDELVLRHWDPMRECFTNTPGIGVKVTYILRDERFLPPGYCCMGIK